MRGILHIAYKLLINDRAKYAALLVGITFAVFLMIEMTSLFAGILARSSATVINIGASIWVMDPAIQTVANTIPLPDYVLDEVRSMPGVKYAVPLYSGSALLKLRDGTYQAANVIGLDDTSLFGRPMLLSGKVEDIYGENAFIAIKDSEFYKLENPQIADALHALDHDAATLLAQDEALAAAAEALHLVHIDYEAGIATYLDVLLADTQFHQAKIADLQAIALRYQDTVALFAALGGGWWNAP
jgi:hypothetical protein